MRQKNKTLWICYSALIAAMYVVLTYLAKLSGLDSGMIQVRFSEMLCILPMFTSAAIPGLAVGCLIANLIGNAVILDIIFGPIATLLGAIGTYMLRKYKWVAPMPPVLANTVIVPFVLAYGYGMTQAIPIMMLTVGAGEIISIYLLGMLFYFALQKRARGIFGNIE